MCWDTEEKMKDEKEIEKILRKMIKSGRDERNDEFDRENVYVYLMQEEYKKQKKKERWKIFKVAIDEIEIQCTISQKVRTKKSIVKH